MKLTGNTILITGGGSGIGEALAHRFHDQGNTVIIAGRRMDTLRRVTAGRSNMHALRLDIESAEGTADFAKRLLAAHPELAVLINNAGIMRFETLDRSRDLADSEATIRSAANASSNAPVEQCPCTAEITGCGRFDTFWMTSEWKCGLAWALTCSRTSTMS